MIMYMIKTGVIPRDLIRLEFIVENVLFNHVLQYDFFSSVEVRSYNYLFYFF